MKITFFDRTDDLNDSLIIEGGDELFSIEATSGDKKRHKFILLQREQIVKMVEWLTAALAAINTPAPDPTTRLWLEETK